jgi:hypothetical protein
MATFKYDKGMLAVGTEQINLVANTIQALLVGAGYSASKAADGNVSDIPSSAILARSGALTGNAIVAGVFQGTIPEFDALLLAAPVAGLVLYKVGGSDASSPLIYYSNDGVGFPFVASGINYFIGYDQTNGGWFQL